MRQQKRVITVGLLLFLVPLLEAGAITSWLSDGQSVSIFPLALLMSSIVLPPLSLAYLGLVAAVWRDSMLLIPLAQSLVGVSALLLAHTVMRYILTNRSLLAEAAHMLGGYGAYLVGLNIVTLLAGGLGESMNHVLPSIGEAVVVVVVLISWTVSVRRKSVRSWSLA